MKMMPMDQVILALVKLVVIVFIIGKFVDVVNALNSISAAVNSLIVK